MKNKKWLFITAGVVSAISLLGIILLTGAHIPAFGMWFYYWQYDANNTYNVVQMYPADLHLVTRHMLDYLLGRVDDLQIYIPVAGEVRPFFGEIEIRHMIDVQTMTRISFIVRNIFMGLFLLCLVPFFVVKNKWQHFWGGWKWTSAAVFIVLAVLVGIISLNWERAWWIFHEIFFNNDYWILRPQVDLLINIVPYQFFFTLSVFMGAFFGAGLVLMFVASFILVRRGRKSSGL
ncbi:MAG: TIGR01906 family membrane protein [Defluviitaleaceae bacterium]|nr:TIGR01906 family membrane protein [Defluviitaleaceae bacterium]